MDFGIDADTVVVDMMVVGFSFVVITVDMMVVGCSFVVLAVDKSVEVLVPGGSLLPA